MTKGVLDAIGRARVEQYQSMADACAWRYYQKCPHVTELEELRGEARFAVCQALDRFPEYNRQHGYADDDTQYLTAYVLMRVNGALMDWGRTADHLARSERAHAKKLDAAAAELKGETRPSSLAAATGIPEDRVRHVQAQEANRLLYLDEGVSSLDGETWASGIADSQVDVESEVTVNATLDGVVTTIQGLDQIQQQLVVMVFYHGVKLGDAGKMLGLGQEKAREAYESAVLQVHSTMLRSVMDGGSDTAGQPIEVTVHRQDADYSLATDECAYRDPPPGHKRCPGCSWDLPIESFTWRNKSKGWRCSLCPECDARRQREKYHQRRDGETAGIGIELPEATPAVDISSLELSVSRSP